MNVHRWTKGSGWGWIWGGEDEVGALNAIDSTSVLSALHAVRTGRVYDLGVVVDRHTSVVDVHAPTEVVAYRTPHGLAREHVFGIESGGLSFNTSLVILSDHAGTQIDALCHATDGDDCHWYNGFSEHEHGFDSGPQRAAGHTIPPIICRGVLLDLAATLGLEELPANFPVGSSLLSQTLDRQRLEILPGEAVFLRTGAMRHWTPDGCDFSRFGGPNSAGLTLEAARWLVEEKGAILIASDTATVECVPAVDGSNFHPVHQYALVEQGVHLGELHNLEALAHDAVYQFTYISLAPKVRGTTAGFAMRPIAIV